MLFFLRFLALVVFGILTVAFGIMSLISSFRYTKHGYPTRKTFRVAGVYLALVCISAALTVIALDPVYISAALAVLAIGLSFVVFYVGASYFNLTLVEKGPRKMFASVWQFLKRLFIQQDSD